MIRQFSWVAIGRIVAAMVQMVTLALVAVWLGPADFGVLAAVLALAVVPQTLLDLGIPTYVLKARAAREDPEMLQFALRVNGATSALLSAVSAAALLLLGTFISPLLLMMLPLAVWVGAERNVEVWMGVALADGDAQLNVTFLVGRRLFGLALMLVTFLIGVPPVLSFAIALASSSLIAVIFAQALLRPRVRVRPRGHRSIAGLVHLTAPFWVHSAATQVRNLDTALVALIADPTQAGYYAVASRLTGPLRILPTSLAAVLLPRISKANGRIDRSLGLTVIATLFAMTMIYISIAIAAPWAVATFLGAAYLPSIVPIQIVCVGLVLGAAASLLAAILQAKGRQRFVASASVAASLVCLVAIVIGTYLAGAAGAAVGLVSSFAVQVCLMGGLLIVKRIRGDER